MASSLFAEAKRLGRAEGRVEGEVAAAQSFCADFARQHHPAVLSDVTPLIRACSDPLRLHEW